MPYPYSYINYTGDGSQQDFVCKSYIDKSHITVKVDGVTKTITTDYTIADGTTIVSFVTAPANGAKIEIGRETSQDARLNDYSDASLLTADQMDKEANQFFFMAQEAIDAGKDAEAQASNTALAASTFYTSGSTEPTSPNIGDLFFNTTTGLLRVYNGSAFINANTIVTRTSLSDATTGQTSFPVNSSTHGTVTSTSQVFYNGILLKEGTGNNGDYTINTGTNTVVLNSGAVAGAKVEIFNF